MIGLNSRTVLSSVLAVCMFTSFQAGIFAQPVMGPRSEAVREGKQPGVSAREVQPAASPEPPSGAIMPHADNPLQAPDQEPVPDVASPEDYMQTAALNIKLSLWEQQKQQLKSHLEQVEQMKATFKAMSNKCDTVSENIKSLLSAIRNTGDTGNAPPPGVNLITPEQLDFLDESYGQLDKDFKDSKAPLETALNLAISLITEKFNQASAMVSSIQAGISNGSVAPSNFPDPNSDDMNQVWTALYAAGQRMGEFMSARGELIRFGISLFQRVAHIIRAYEMAGLTLTPGQQAVKDAADQLRESLLDIV